MKPRTPLPLLPVCVLLGVAGGSVVREIDDLFRLPWQTVLGALALVGVLSYLLLDAGHRRGWLR